MLIGLLLGGSGLWFSCAKAFPDTEMLGLLLLKDAPAAASPTTPTVQSVSPADGSTGLNVLGEVLTIVFSEEMDASTVTAQSASGTCSGSVQFSADNFATCAGGTIATSDNITFTFTPSITQASEGITARVLIAASIKSAKSVSLASAWVSTNGLKTFSPADYAGLVLWLRGNSITGLTDGLALTVWSDSSGQGNHAYQIVTPTARPLYRTTGGSNNTKWVEFQSASLHHLNLNEFMNFSAPTLFVVGYSGGAASEWFFGDIGADVDERFGIRSVTNFARPIVMDAAANDPYGGTVGGAVLNTWRIMTLRLSATGTNYYTDGAVIASPGLGGYSTATTWNGTFAAGFSPRIGNHPGLLVEHLNGGVAEIIMYNVALTDAERAAVECYLSRKYSITGPAC